GFPKTEKTASARAAQSGEEIIEADLNQTRTLDQVHNRTQALADGNISHRERLLNSGFRRDHVAHSIILKANDGVRVFAQFRQSFLRLRHAPFPLEGKWQRRE